jgi:hypothetical protein
MIQGDTVDLRIGANTWGRAVFNDRFREVSLGEAEKYPSDQIAALLKSASTLAASHFKRGFAPAGLEATSLVIALTIAFQLKQEGVWIDHYPEDLTAIYLSYDDAKYFGDLVWRLHYQSITIPRSVVATTGELVASYIRESKG